MMDLKTDVAVIGGGAAGLAAGFYSAREGADTLLLEQNEKLGRKMYITGKGRCNLTNDAGPEEFLNEVPRNPKFLFSALSLLSPQDMKQLMTDHGCPVKTERGRRVFPVSDKASDVTRAWERALKEAGCRIRLNAKVLDLCETAEGFTLETEGLRIFAKCVVVATGGLSYPSTGSTGDGYLFAERLGIRLKERRPSLIALTTSDPWTGSLQGLSLRNVRLHAEEGRRTVYDQLGEMLFTHDGISGPLALELSCHLTLPPSDQLRTRIDLKPGLTMEQLQQRLLREIAAAGKKKASTILNTMLPQRLAGAFTQIMGLDGDIQANQLPAAERSRLCSLIKAFPVHIDGTHPIAEAVVTRGGIDVRALDPTTMSVRQHPRLFFAGEVIDVDAHTGGYNLQIAFSTGALAGKSAAIRAIS